MWGICFGEEALKVGLFQKVVQYEIVNGEAFVICPKGDYKLDIKQIEELVIPPKYNYGEQIVPCNHPDMIGTIASIHWHFNLKCCFYTIKINEKIKNKRYFDKDLVSYEKSSL